MAWTTLGVTVATVAPAAGHRDARAAGLVEEEQRRLAERQLVVRTTEFRVGDRRFVGGLAYLLVDVDTERLSSIVRDPERYRQLFPAVSEVKLEEIRRDGRARVQLSHQMGPIGARYTAWVEFREQGRIGRFWLDRDSENDLEAAYGFVRLTPVSDTSTLVSFGLAFDLGEGVAHLLFEERIRDAALRFPERLLHAARSSVEEEGSLVGGP